MPPPGGFGGGFGGIVGARGTGASGIDFAASPRVRSEPLIIRNSHENPKTLADLRQDLTIMSRILTKSLAQEGLGLEPDRVLGVVFYANTHQHRLQSFYLEGYGALFLLNLQMPLLPPPASTAKETTAAPSDSTWQATKRELYGPPSPYWRQIGPNAFAAPEAVRQLEAALEAPPAAYDATKVQTLKKTLLAALKNASNIRHLKADDWITVAVTGPPVLGPVSVPPEVSEARGLREPGLADAREGLTPAHKDASPPPATRTTLRPPMANPTSPTTLVIRVKKFEVDAFAKGRLKLDEFERKASLVIY